MEREEELSIISRGDGLEKEKR